MGKAAHLSRRARRDPADGRAPTATEEVVGVFTVANAHGLHARPAARLVSRGARPRRRRPLRNLTTGAGPVPAGSLSRVATLGALHGHQVEVAASGPQAQEAVEHLLALAARRFDEADEPVPSTGPGRADAAARPRPGAPRRRDRDRAGCDAGRRRRSTDADDRPAPGRRVAPDRRGGRRRAPRHRARSAALTAREVGAEEAGIFDAHLMLLADAELLADVRAPDRRGRRRGRGVGRRASTDVERAVGRAARPLSARAGRGRPRRRRAGAARARRVRGRAVAATGVLVGARPHARPRRPPSTWRR